MTLRRIGVLSAGQVSGCIYAVFGLVVGAFLSLAALFGAAVMPAGANGTVPAVVVGIGAIVVLPILYGILGFIGGIITAALYNVAAAIVGGIELEFDRPA